MTRLNTLQRTLQRMMLPALVFAGLGVPMTTVYALTTPGACGDSAACGAACALAMAHPSSRAGPANVTMYFAFM